MFDEKLRETPLESLLELPFAFPFPTSAEREKWTQLPEDTRDAIASQYAVLRDTPYPMIPASAFMAFTTTGDRQIFEKPYFFRRRKLILSTLAYCVTGEEAALQDAIDGLWCIMEETSWVLSAHNNDAHPGSTRTPLPDPRRPVIDLFSAQTGSILAQILRLIGEELDRVTPVITQRAHTLLEERLLTPFECVDEFWWMGFTRKDLINWTPWILSSLLIVAACEIPQRARLARFVTRALGMGDSYLACIPEDGGCDEGVGYWNMAGGALLDMLTIVSWLTGEKLTFWENEKIRRLLRYPYSMWIGGEWFANFADCDAKPYVSGERLVAVGKYLQDPLLEAFGTARMTPISAEVSDTPQFLRLLLRLFMQPGKAGEALPPEETWLSDLQVRGKRQGRLSVFMKGGHNGEAHNHNDVGTFIVARDGVPVIVDIGNMTYTAKTFSSERYTLWNTRSRNHNVPLIGNFEQAPGTEYRAEVLSSNPFLTLEMAKAYPKEAGVLTLQRDLRLIQGGLRLIDRIALKQPLDVTEVLILQSPPEVLKKGTISLGHGLTLTYPEEMNVEVTELPVTDARLSRVYTASLWRLALRAKTGAEHTIELTIKEED
ncbi:MAG: heparinase II/III family protein [Clostridia bacterium]|nr:heparinase II/III family protein [Clostridia bacterium]